LDEEAFENAVVEVEQQKKGWSLRTASRAVVSKAVGASRLARDEYAGEAEATRLASELRAHWACDPICTTVPIRVWQRYIFKIWDGDDVAAASEVLRVMPCRGDRTLPSELWSTLLESGLWSEVVLVPEYWPQARGRGLQAIAEEGEVDTEGGQSESRLRRMLARADSFSVKGLKVYQMAPEALRHARRQASRNKCACHIGPCSVQ